MLDPDCIRRDFPILDRVVNGYKLIYFDNAATTQKPVQVINAVREFYSKYNANIHRAAHTLAQEATKLYEDAHVSVANFIGADGIEEVIFVKNTTEAINLVAYSLALSEFGRDDEVLLTIGDHHSNIVPWYILSRIKGFKIRFVDIAEDGSIDIDDLQSKINSRTKVVAVPHISNVMGVVNDIREIGRIAHEVGAYFLVDGAQSVPHMPIDVKSLDIDFLAFSGHKMLGPTGIGVLYGKKEFLEQMPPFLGGGDMISSVKGDVVTGNCHITYNVLPWKFEAGTPNIAGAVGLMEAIKYLEGIGMNNIMVFEKRLTEYVLKRIGGIDGIEVYGSLDVSKKGALISFNVAGLDPHEMAVLLDSYGIMVRSGLHCAQPLHERLGIPSTVRASFYIYNTIEEIDRFVDVLSEIVGMM
jgi:cysteine desulfurase/selenocysteine lyase